eukprot:741548-Alexandrium_andersonii.AAC.1
MTRKFRGPRGPPPTQGAGAPVSSTADSSGKGAARLGGPRPRVAARLASRWARASESVQGQHRGGRPIACRVQDCHHGAEGLRGRTARIGDPCSAHDVEPQLLARRARPSIIGGIGRV